MTRLAQWTTSVRVARRRSKVGQTRLDRCVSLVPLVLCALIVAAFTPGVLQDDGGGAPILHPVLHLAADTGVFVPLQPGEAWGGGNPTENCLYCDASALVGHPAGGQSTKAGDDVNASNGDFTFSDTLFSAPSVVGNMDFTLTYSAERAWAEQWEGDDALCGNNCAGADYENGDGYVDGAGYGWADPLDANVLFSNGSPDHPDAPDLCDGLPQLIYNSGSGSQTTYCAPIGSAGCPAGDYNGVNKYTGPGSSYLFCAPNRVNAQVVQDNQNFTDAQIAVAGGKQLLTFNSMNNVAQIGNLQDPNAQSIAMDFVGASSGPCSGTSLCTTDTDNTSGRTIYVGTASGGTQATFVVDPNGRQWNLGHTDNNENLTSIQAPGGMTWNLTYSASAGLPYNHELTAIENPNGFTKHIAYNQGMVSSETDYSGTETTHYTYSLNNCSSATTSGNTTILGCTESSENGTPITQQTQVQYPDAEIDNDQYAGGRLLDASFGSTATTNFYSPTTGDALWQYSYQDPPPGYSNNPTVETITPPASMGGNQITVTTDSVGNIISYTNAVTGAVTYQMYNDNENNDLDELCWTAQPGVVVPPGASCSTPPSGAMVYGYDQYGDLTSQSDAAGNTTRYGYYAGDGLLCWTLQPPAFPGGSSCSGYGSAPGGAPPGGSSVDTYDAYGDLASTQANYGNNGGSPTAITSVVYDADGNVQYSIPPDGYGSGISASNPYATVETYDPTTDRLATTTAPSGLVTTYSYDANGNVTTQVASSGAAIFSATTKSYDADGRLCWSYVGTNAIGTSDTQSCPGTTGAGYTGYTYSLDTSAPASVIDPNGDQTTYSYADDEFPTQPTTTDDPSNNNLEESYTAYDAYGQSCGSGPEPIANGCGAQTPGDTFAAYDEDGRRAASYDQMGHETTYSYGDNAYPSLVTASDDVSLAATTTTAYDADGRPVTSTDPEGNVVTVGYNAQGLICYKTPTLPTSYLSCGKWPSSGGSSTYQYNAYNELQSMTDYGPSGAEPTSSYSYDLNRNLTSAPDDNGQTVSYLYDTDNRVVCTAYPVASGSSCGSLASPATPSSTNTIVDQTYNAASEETAVSDWYTTADAITFSGYNALGKVGQVNYPTTNGGETLSYAYFAAGNLKSATYGGTLLTSAGGTAVANGMNDSWSYNGDEQASSYTTTLTGGVSSPTQIYTNYGQVQNASNPSGSGSAVDTYSYQPNGEITQDQSSAAPSTPTTLAYNSGSEVTSIDNQSNGQVTTYAYTPDGQRCSAQTSSGVIAGASCLSAQADSTGYQWNAFGQLCWAGTTTTPSAPCTSAPSGTTTYSYNGLGLRMTETPPSGWPLAFTWDFATGSDPLLLDDSNNAYIYGPTPFGGTAPLEQIALTGNQAGTKTFLSSIPSGVQAAFTSAGVLTEQAAYSTYGTQTIQSGSDVTPFGFQGSYTDGANSDGAPSLLYLINRYYDPASAQFLSIDPAVAQTGQPYAAFNEDPVNATDPLGLGVAGNGVVCEGVGICGAATNPAVDNVGCPTNAQVCGSDPSAPSSVANTAEDAFMGMCEMDMTACDEVVYLQMCAKNMQFCEATAKQASNAAVADYECIAGGGQSCTSNPVNAYMQATTYAQVGLTYNEGQQLAEMQPGLQAVQKWTGEGVVCGIAGLGAGRAAQAWSDEWWWALRDAGSAVSEDTVAGGLFVGGAAIGCSGSGAVDYIPDHG